MRDLMNNNAQTQNSMMEQQRIENDANNKKLQDKIVNLKKTMGQKKEEPKSDFFMPEGAQDQPIDQIPIIRIYKKRKPNVPPPEIYENYQHPTNNNFEDRNAKNRNSPFKKESTKNYDKSPTKVLEKKKYSLSES